MLALGGGAVLDPRDPGRCSASTGGLPDVGLSDAVKRVGLGSARPLLLGNVRARVKALLDERLPVYREVATVIVDTDGRPAEDVAARGARGATSSATSRRHAADDAQEDA